MYKFKRMETKVVFQDLQPLCNNVIKNMDLRSIQELNYHITNILTKEKELANDSVSVLDDLKEYISFPLVLVLKKYRSSSGRKDSVLEIVLQCLGKVLLNSISVEWQYFHDIFTLLFLCITSTENPQLVDDDITEDCKSEALKNVSQICSLLSQDQRIRVCSESFRPQLGHAVYICLKIAEKEKNKELILTSLNTLKELSSSSSYENDKNYVNQLRYTWAGFLPGIVLSTTRIATRKEIQSHKILVSALQCWQYFVGLVMQDEFLSTVVENLGMSEIFLSFQKKLNLQDEEKVQISSEILSGPSENFSKSYKSQNRENSAPRKLENIKLDSNWVKSTSERLFILTKSICEYLVSHNHWNVRKTLASLCHFLIQHCSRSLQDCTILCLETLITLKSDPVTDVCEAAQKALKEADIFSLSTGSRKLMELLEEKLFSIATRLPNIIRTQDEGSLLVHIRQLRGFLDVMGEKVEGFVRISAHLQRLHHSLTMLFTYDYSDSDILLEKITVEDSLEIMSIKPSLGYSFKYFHSDAIFRCASSCCSLLGQYGDILLVVDQCLDTISQSAVHRNEAVLLLYLIMQGTIHREKSSLCSEEKEKLFSAIYDVIIACGLLESPVSITHKTEKSNLADFTLVPRNSSNTSIPVELSKNNVILISNTLKLIGSCALYLQRYFYVFLSKILCPVMEKAGESNILISHAAFKCLENIASSCGFDSVPSLVEETAHLFWFELSEKLKSLPDYPSSPQVLRVVLKNHHKEISFIEELVDDVLESLDTYYIESSLPLLTVLLSYVEAQTTLAPKIKVKELQCEESSKEGNISVKMFVTELHKKHNDARNELRECEREEAEATKAESGFKDYFENNMKKENEETDQNCFREEKNIPKNISLTVQILERCSYLLFKDDRKCQLIILDIIKHCFLILDDYEDEKLPCCHKIWKPLVLLLKGKDYIVFLKALEICLIMVSGSKDFLRNRFVKELFPSLTYFLDSQSSVSMNKTNQSGYYHTPSFKAQCHVLKGLPSLLQHVKISLLNAEVLAQCILLYLDERQPHELNRLALEVLETIRSLHPDLVWLTLAFTKEPFRIMSPHPSLNNIYVNGCKINNLIPSVAKCFEELS